MIVDASFSAVIDTIVGVGSVSVVLFFVAGEESGVNLSGFVSY